MDEIQLLDIADELLVINKVTIEKLFQEENQNTLVLYLFYYKTAKWQKHNPIKANDDYCKKCLHWGIDKLQAAKKRLKEMNLIETIKRSNEKNIITGWYIKVNYFIEESTIPETTIPISPQLGKQETNTINNNNKILNNNNKYIVEILDYLNKKTNSNYKTTTKSTTQKINARLREGFTLEDFKKVIDKKTDEWKGTQLEQYLRPDTLFGTKFESYLNQNIIKKEHKESRYEKEQRIMKEWLEKNE